MSAYGEGSVMNLLKRSQLARAFFLALIGPVIGAIFAVVATPFLIFGFMLFGGRLWLWIYEMGFAPSVATTALVIFLQTSGLRIVTATAITIAASSIITAAWWILYVGFSPDKSGFISFVLYGSFSGFALSLINYKIVKDGMPLPKSDPLQAD